MSEFLYKWQELSGALVGGVIGLLAALIVARDARKREERAAAMTLIVDLVSVSAAWNQLNDRLGNVDVSPDEQAQWIVDRLLGLRPRLLPLFDSAMFRVMPIHDHLAAHLSLFRSIYGQVENRLERLRQAVEQFRSTRQQTLSREEIASHINLIADGFRRSVEHATCTRTLLEKLVLTRFASWHRLRLRLFPCPRERECSRLLETGVSGRGDR